MTDSWYVNWCIDNTIVISSEMTFSLMKDRKLCNVIMHVTSANQKTESFLYCWLCPNVMFDIACFFAFVWAFDIISSILAIRQMWHLPSSSGTPSRHAGSNTRSALLTSCTTWLRSPVSPSYKHMYTAVGYHMETMIVIMVNIFLWTKLSMH